MRDVYVETALSLRRREIPTRALAMRVRLTKSPEDYAAARATRREAAYEALVGAGRSHWRVGDRVHVYRDATGRARLAFDADDPSSKAPEGDPRDYDVAYYQRLLRETFAARLARALAPEDFEVVFADVEQQRLFERSLAEARPVLTMRRSGDPGAEAG